RVGTPDWAGHRTRSPRRLPSNGRPRGAFPGVSLSPTGSSMHPAARLDTLGTEQAYVVLAAARRLEAAGHRVVHLEIGEPDMPTPPHAAEESGRAAGRAGGRAD